MRSWLLKNKVRSFGLAYLALAAALVLFSRFEASHNYHPDFLDRAANGHRPVARALVAASRQSGDTEWISVLTNASSTLVTYTPFIYHTDGDSVGTKGSLHLAANKGREANVYLSFIIDNYDFLPEYTVFIHGHESAWHQENSLLITLQMLNFKALDTDGYVNLRCDWYPSCPAEIRPHTHDGIPWGPGVHKQDAENAIVEAWPEFFPGVDLPYTISSQCCAQFAVTRDTIRRRDKEMYIRMREWLLRTALIDDISGRVFEKLWAYIFTNEPVHCPPPPVCACKNFNSCDSNKQWPMPPMPIVNGMPVFPPH